MVGGTFGPFEGVGVEGHLLVGEIGPHGGVEVARLHDSPVERLHLDAGLDRLLDVRQLGTDGRTWDP